MSLSWIPTTLHSAVQLFIITSRGTGSHVLEICNILYRNTALVAWLGLYGVNWPLFATENLKNSEVHLNSSRGFRQVPHEFWMLCIRLCRLLSKRSPLLHFGMCFKVAPYIVRSTMRALPFGSCFRRETVYRLSWELRHVYCQSTKRPTRCGVTFLRVICVNRYD